MLEINHGHIVTVASSLGLFSTAGVEVCHYKAFPSFNQFISSQIDYSSRSVHAALIFLQASGSYLCAVCRVQPSTHQLYIFCHKLTLVWHTNSSSRSRWARPQYGPILISSFTWRQWEDTGSRWNWRALQCPREQINEAKGWHSVLVNLSKVSYLVLAHQMRWLRVGMRCLHVKSVELGLIRCCSSPTSSYKACMGLLFRAVCPTGACSRK